MRNLAFLLYLFIMFFTIAASEKKTSCRIRGSRADCSRLSLDAVPPDLPGNITSLDLSHNRLSQIPPESLAPYVGLLDLDVGFNSITSLDGGVCRALPLLQTLNVEHNEVHIIHEEDVSACGSLTGFRLASNRLKLKGEVFAGLQNLKFLDVSKNNLDSAKLGSKPQMPNLVELWLGFNTFTTLAKDDFALFSHSTSLQVLNLESVTIKTVQRGSFQPISQLRTLIMDGSNMGTTGISKLCSALSGTSIQTLSLQRMKLVTLTNVTFKDLQQSNLTFLDLSENGLGKIEEGSFQWLSKLNALVLSDNNIKHLTKKTFQGLDSLKRLDLRKALVKSHTSATPIIDDFSFQPLVALETLCLQRTSVRVITEHTFTGLKSLKDLDLSWSSYTSLKNISNKTLISLGGSLLLKLNLTATAIVQIQHGAFSHLGNLTHLLLDFNYIKQTLYGPEFQGLDQLQELHLSFNRQTINLSSMSFVGVPLLKVLTLCKSLTAMSLNLDPSPFEPLSNLAYLDLSNNNIANLRGSLLTGLFNLKVLNLQHNNLARLWKDANLGGPVLYLKGLEKLTSLQMDNNGLDEIPAEALTELRNLHDLSLSNNLLNNLKDSVFDSLTSLKVLHLQRNLITAVRPEVFLTPLTNLSSLFMDRNPFDCTCESILWFVTWLNTTNTTSIPGLRGQYICNTPLAYFNRSISDFNTLSCRDMAPFQALYVLSSTLVGLLTVTALLLRFHGWRIQFYWNVLVNRTLGFSDTRMEEVRQFEYDAYIIHAEVDTSWVERALMPLEGDACRFCLEDRDSTPGMSQLESITENMRNSRKILFVVTESLLSDSWCSRFKAHHALHQVIEANRDSVILVFLQDVHDYKLSHSLFLRRGMLRQRCVLHWPVQRERVAAFRQKLLIALGMSNRFPPLP
ncbi:toll-like receptor 3 [Syngnathoides biaculeatus]|uniref:toll-like receptor 3 n=1 Tax=Syngnathoides biaculeatus TaxID=300417 RepID=UPI00279C6788|nr:toll-like receptor 3 [Syngnathoides biaculeatus]WHT06279.1 toll like receptor 3 [Syngnathoides biaculeatus]